MHGIAVLFLVVALGALTACGPRRVGPPPHPPAMAALDLEDDDVYIRVVDVGPGLCAVVRIPGGHAMVYDAGHWNGRHCIAAVRDG